MTSDTVASRAAALALLSGALRDGQAVDTRFQKAASTLEARDRAFVRLLVATALRRLGQIDAVLAHFVNRTPPAPVEDILRLGAAQLLFLDTAPHAAVDTAVQLVKKVRHPKMSGLVNAVLRRVADQGKGLMADHDAPRLNTPDWLWQRWVRTFGEDGAHRIAEAHLHEAPLDLTLKDAGSTEKWATELKADVLSTESLRCPMTGLVQELPGFQDGAWWVQDAAAALPARVLLQALGDTNDKTIADLCAAPGGKTLQLAAAGCRVTAVDKSNKRLDRLRDNLKRSGLPADVIQADVEKWQPKQSFDAVLLDAPCSATGTLRRHPDLTYLKGDKDIKKFPEHQKALLKRAVGFLKPAGHLIYAVCSLEPEEGQGVVDAVVGDGGLSQVPIDPNPLGVDPAWIEDTGALRTVPCYWSKSGGMDGFYIALLKKA